MRVGDRYHSSRQPLYQIETAVFDFLTITVAAENSQVNTVPGGKRRHISGEICHSTMSSNRIECYRFHNAKCRNGESCPCFHATDIGSRILPRLYDGLEVRRTFHIDTDTNLNFCRRKTP